MKLTIDEVWEGSGRVCETRHVAVANSGNFNLPQRS